jgi:predicted small secreted protein
MKKLLVIVAVLFTVSMIATSCGGSRRGGGSEGCPTANKAKPFRA